MYIVRVWRVVIDTNVVTAALRSRDGAAFAVMDLIATGYLKPLLSVPLLFEYEAVLRRPEQIREHQLSESEISRYLASVVMLAEPVTIHFLWRPQLKDPKDEMVLETAINGRADALVTHNVRDLGPAAAQFSLPVYRPGELLKRLKS